MTTTIQVQMIGVDQLLAKLKDLKYQTRYKTGRNALRKAANLVAAAARSNAARLDDQGTGRSIAKNVAVRWNGRHYRATGDLAFRVGILNGAVLPKINSDGGAGGATPHWRLLEFGTSKMPATPFLRPALFNNVQAATDVAVREYIKSIDRALKKGAA